MKITKHGQSCFLVETGDTKILIDPGSYVTDLEKFDFLSFPKIDILLVTHIHSDHFDAENIFSLIKRDLPTVFGPIDVVALINEKIPEIKTIVAQANLSKDFDDTKIECFSSKHGPLPNGKPEPEVVGYVVDDGINRFYAPGDSIFLDRNTNADIVAVPFCGQVVMTIDEARSEIMKSNPKIVIPIHYDNPIYPVDVNEFAEKIKSTGIMAKILKNGESFEI